jgi:hypothetical protein
MPIRQQLLDGNLNIWCGLPVGLPNNSVCLSEGHLLGK